MNIKDFKDQIIADYCKTEKGQKFLRAEIKVWYKAWVQLIVLLLYFMPIVFLIIALLF